MRNVEGGILAGCPGAEKDKRLLVEEGKEGGFNWIPE